MLTLMPFARSSCTSSTRSFSRPSPAAMTYTIVSLLRMPLLTQCGHTIANTRSSPMLTPTHGSAAAFLPSPAAAAVNMPTRLSYRPPAAIEPTPTCDSSTSSSSSAFASFLARFSFFSFLGGSARAGVEEEAKALASLKPGGAEASTIAS